VELGQLVAVDPRLVWQHEAHHFTPWLLGHANQLADTLGIDLELTSNEHPVGGFALDLIGTDLTNDCVLIVENQLAGTDHAHLGQLLTYAAGTDAATIVWVATSFREEHRQALDWLNSLAGENARFFGIEIGAVRIADSPVAPLFTLRAQPNDWHAQLSEAARSTTRGSGRGELYRQFWAKLLERCRSERPGWTRARIPSGGNWMTMPSVIKHAVIGVNFTQNQQIRTELYIDSGSGETNDAIFAQLLGHQAEIEASFGAALSWEPMPNRRAARLAVYEAGEVTIGGAHDGYIDWFIDVGTRLRQALAPWADVVTGDADGLVAGGDVVTTSPVRSEQPGDEQGAT
jgi:hypothetical protein